MWWQLNWTDSIVTRSRIDRFIIVSITALFPSSLSCQSSGFSPARETFPQYVQEFFLSDTVRNQDRGELQVTVGVGSQEDVGTTDILKLEYGLTRRLQLGFDQSYGNTDEHGPRPSKWGPASAGMQYQIRNSSKFVLAAGLAVGIPSGPGSEIEFQPTILAARTFRSAQIHATFEAGLGKENPSFQYNLASVFSVHPRWYPTLEFSVRSLRDRTALYLTPGVYRRIGQQFEFGIGTPFGLSENAGSAGVVAKLTLEIRR